MRGWLVFALAAVALDAAALESIRVQGSASLSHRLGVVLAERLGSRFGDVSLDWRPSVSTASFNALFEGVAQAAITAGSIAPEEIELARRLDLDLREAALALGGVAVVVHPENPISRLSLEQLQTLYERRIVRWLGVGGSDEPVQLFSPPDESDTQTVFRKLVLGDESALASEVEYLAPDEILERVAAERAAIGFVSIVQDRTEVRTVPIVADQGGDAVLPEAASIAGGTYPLRHGIWLYTIGKPDGALRDFLTFLFLHDGPALMEELGLVPVSGLTALVRSVRPRARPVEVSVTRISFGYRGRRLGRAARETLLDLGARLAATDEGLWISGHAEPTEDGRGHSLAQDRAEAVARFLEEAGVARLRMILKGRGTSEPLNPHDTLDGRRSNRRADIWILREP